MMRFGMYGSVMAGLLAACGGGGGSPPALVGLTVNPPTVSMPRISWRQLSAVAAYADGSVRDVSGEAAWIAGDASVASVAGAGVVTAVAPGTTAVTTTFGGLTASAAVTVTPAVIGLAVFPAGVSLPLGRTVQLAAVAALEDGTREVVTARASWISDGAATVTAGRIAPAVGANAGAVADITAELEGFFAHATATLAAEPPPIGPGYDDDPFLPLQWHLRNTGQTAYAAHPGLAGNDVNASASWAGGFTGKGVKVAVVDTGLEIAHEDLAANVMPGSWNFSTGMPDPTSSATDGDHGTSVAGLVAAARGNGAGGMGVAPAAGLNGYNLITESNQTLANWISSLGGGAGGVGPKSDDAWVFNQSFGSYSTTPVDEDPAVIDQYLDGVTNLRGGLGAVYVKAAGNGFEGFQDGSSAADCTLANAFGVTCHNAGMDPGNALPMNVVVGALNALGRRSSYSSAGAAIWVSAPGGEYGVSENWSCGGSPCPSCTYDPAMVTTDQTSCGAGYARADAVGSEFDEGKYGNSSCSYTNSFNGTSSATPVVSGVAALMLEANPSLAWRDVKAVLASTARQVDSTILPVTVALPDGAYTVEPGWTTNAAGYRFHDWYGFGAVDADSAVEMARTYAPEQLGRLEDTGWLPGGVPSGAIPDFRAAGVTGQAVVPVVAGVRTVEAVQVQVSIDHAWLGDLGVELTSPSGTRSVLLNAYNGFGSSSGVAAIQLSSNAFFGESAGGIWTLKVVDAAEIDTGTLVGWKLRVYGHRG